MSASGKITADQAAAQLPSHPGTPHAAAYERVLERNLTEPDLGTAAKIGTEVRRS
jgi:hypothetical protein